MSFIYDARGNRVGDARAEPETPTETKVVDELPHWLASVKYRGDDDIIIMRVVVPATQHNPKMLVDLEATPHGARLLVEALQACVTRSEQTMQVVDVPSSASR